MNSVLLELFVNVYKTGMYEFTLIKELQWEPEKSRIGIRLIDSSYDFIMDNTH